MTEQVLRKIARQYQRNNPICPLRYRAFYSGGIRRGEDYRYHADFDRLFPECAMGDGAVARCVYRAAADETIGMTVRLMGRVRVSLNGTEVFASNIFTERNNDVPVRLDLNMHEGSNLIEIICHKTPLGFGAIFGTWLPKWDYIFYFPFDEEMEGVAYSRLNDDGEPIEWLPKWEKQPPLYPRSGESVLLATGVVVEGGDYVFSLAGAYVSEATIDGESVPVIGRGFSAHLERGKHIVLLRATGIIEEKPTLWAFGAELCHPLGINGFGEWMYLFPMPDSVKMSEVRDFNHPIAGTYWQLWGENLWLRPYYNDGNFGKWNYPLGVTIYGLIHAALLLEDEALLAYTRAHLQQTVDLFPYAMWDRDHHGGAATIHNLLAGIDSLDDCGAFGAALLEGALYADVTGYETIADYISGYILNHQSRTEDGAFFRKKQMHAFHNGTLWADDLYMAVPFLCRRYRMTHEVRYLNDAVRQVESYSARLYMPEEKLMSHVYDFKHHRNTGVPWGRANGWTLVAITEILPRLPEQYSKSTELIRFFRELCDGVLAVQGADGRWHQVLNDSESYPETSCTAMFIVAFVRGFKMGLLAGRYLDAAKRAWASVMEHCVDSDGNVLGVCRGSEFSFSPDYYKYDLLPRVNDTHGIGIVLLAGSELASCREDDNEVDQPSENN